MTAATELCSVTKVFEGADGARVVAVDRMSLTVRPGQVVGLLGDRSLSSERVDGILGSLGRDVREPVRLENAQERAGPRRAGALSWCLASTAPPTRSTPWPRACPGARPGHARVCRASRDWLHDLAAGRGEQAAR